MKTKKFLLIITALCCTMTISACNKKQNDTGNAGNVLRETTASKAEENTVIDVFRDLNVTFEGENGSGEAIFEYTGDSDYVKNNVNFELDRRNGIYKNGDTATIKLDFSENNSENKITFKETKHEYTVNGLWGIINSSDEYDFSECNKILEERILDMERSDSLFNVKELDIGNTFWVSPINEGTSCWKILSAEYEPIQGKFAITAPEKPKNRYSLFYKVTLLCEKTIGSSDVDLEANSPYAVGDTKEWKYVICETTYNVFVEKDSNIVKINPEAIQTVGGDIMSQTTIYGRIESETEYNDNFDEYFEKVINRNNNFTFNEKREIFDVKIK